MLKNFYQFFWKELTLKNFHQNLKMNAFKNLRHSKYKRNDSIMIELLSCKWKELFLVISHAREFCHRYYITLILKNIVNDSFLWSSNFISILCDLFLFILTWIGLCYPLICTLVIKNEQGCVIKSHSVAWRCAIWLLC